MPLVVATLALAALTSAPVAQATSTACAQLIAQRAGFNAQINALVAAINGNPNLTPAAKAAAIAQLEAARAAGIAQFNATLATQGCFPAPAVVSGGTAYALAAQMGAATSIAYTYGVKPPALVPLMGDWDGDGVRSPGVYQAGEFKLSNLNLDGFTAVPTITFTFGDPRGFPVAGDFDGDNVEDVAVYRAGTWQIRLSTGATSTFSYGTGSWPATVPLTGDWNGDNIDGIGTYTYSSASWQLRNSPSAGASNIGPFVYGTPNASYPVTGDWNLDRITTIGTKQGTSWTLRDANSAGDFDWSFNFGNANDLPFIWRGS